MSLRRTYTASAVLFAFVTAFSIEANAGFVSLRATDTESQQEAGGSNFTDDRVRAYTAASGAKISNLMKFDFSLIPDAAVITSMTLTTYHEAGFGNPYQDPIVKLYRTATDSWSRANANDAWAGLNESLTGNISGFPSGSGTPFTWNLNVNAVNWATDLADDIFSLVMRNEKSTYSYVYWHGSDNQNLAPKLDIQYSMGAVPEPASLAMWGLAGSLGLVIARRRKRTMIA